MLHLAQLLEAHPFPAGLDRVRRSFARQPDNQTCGAAAIRHGLLLGGISVPAAVLEAVLDIRANQGTAPVALRKCLRRLGLEARQLRKPGGQSTEDFLEGLRAELDRGAFLLPCIYAGEHWACLGAWQDGRAGLVDSFFGKPGPSLWPRSSSGLGFLSLSPENLDAIDWAHFITLVRPGRWRAQYDAWLPARRTLLRLHPVAAPAIRPVTIAEAVRSGVHQYLDDADYSYRGMNLYLRAGSAARIEAEDPGGDAIGVETVGAGREAVVVLRRLRAGRKGAPELIVRGAALCAANLGDAGQVTAARRNGPRADVPPALQAAGW